MRRIQTLRTRFERETGRKTQLEETITDLSTEMNEARRELHRQEHAREIIREVGLRTQEQLSYHINDIVTQALEAVFDDPYELVVEFVQRRNKTECDLYFAQGDAKINPLEASGGGAVDVAAFALRIVAWSMMVPKRRKVMILDEPLKFLSEDMQERGSMMIKELSERLGIQFIIVTHNETLAEHADKTFTIRKTRKRESKVLES